MCIQNLGRFNPDVYDDPAKTQIRTCVYRLGVNLLDELQHFCL